MSAPNLENKEVWKKVRAEFTFDWSDVHVQEADAGSYVRQLVNLKEGRARDDGYRSLRRHFTPTGPERATSEAQLRPLQIPGTALNCPCGHCVDTRRAVLASPEGYMLPGKTHCTCSSCTYIHRYRRELKTLTPEIWGVVSVTHKRSDRIVSQYEVSSELSLALTWRRGATLFERMQARSEIEKRAVRLALANMATRRRRTRNVPTTAFGHVNSPHGYGRVSVSQAMRELWERQLARVLEHKHPITADRYVGVEIECGFPAYTRADYSSQRLHRAIAKAGLSRHVNVGSDISIQDLGYAYELRILATESELREILEKTCAVLKAEGAAVNKTCGLHVHLDHRATSLRDPETTYRRLSTAQRWLWAVVAPSRRQNQYVRRNVRRARPRAGHHYDGISARSAMNAHQTVEVRLHHGTTNAEKIWNWVRLLLAVTDGPDLERCPKKLATLAKKLSLPEDLTRWIAQRAIVLGGAALEDLTVPSDALTEEWTEDLEETVVHEAGIPWPVEQFGARPGARPETRDDALTLPS